MKKTLIILLALILCASACATAETTGEPEIIGSIVDGSYTLLVHAEPGDTGWTLDSTEELEAVLAIAEAVYTDEGYFARLVPVHDGTATVRLLHQDGFITDRVYAFDLLVKDGAVRESTGGSYAASPSEEEQDPYLSGEWVEKDTQFTRMTITKNTVRGWNVEISSPLTHEAYIFKATIRYDCAQEAFAYNDGEQYDAPVETSEETGTPGEPVCTGESGRIQFAEDSDGTLCRVWNNVFFIDHSVVFVRTGSEN